MLPWVAEAGADEEEARNPSSRGLAGDRERVDCSLWQPMATPVLRTVWDRLQRDVCAGDLLRATRSVR